MTDTAFAALQGFAPHLSRSREAVADDLESFAALLRKWQSAQNLVSRETLSDLWTRHMRDSLQILPHLPPEPGLILDFGSGGGFPALPLAIALKASSTRFVLVESNRRKCSFLRTVARELDLTVKVLDQRAESLDLSGFASPDVITSRATASLGQLLFWMAPFVGLQTRLLLHKGREHGEEWAEASAHWDADMLVLPSVTDPNGVILDLRNLNRKSV